MAASRVRRRVRELPVVGLAVVFPLLVIYPLLRFLPANQLSLSIQPFQFTP